MNKELNKRGLDKSTFVDIARVGLFALIVLVHAWFSREASILSWYMPIPSALLFTWATVKLKDLKKKWSNSTDQDGVTARNPSRWIFLGMTIALYIIGFIDRG